MFIQKRVSKFLKRLYKKAKKTFKIERFFELIVAYYIERCLNYLNDIFSIQSVIDIIMK
jgi:hypothetical protein